MKTILLLLIFSASVSLGRGQNKKLRDFYEAYFKIKAQDLNKHYESLSIILEDPGNAFIKCEGLPKSENAPIWDMKVWRSKKGQLLFGVFKYTCNDMGCAGQVFDFRFYDEYLRDVTLEVIDPDQIIAYFKDKIPHSELEQGGFFVKIPQNGNNIRLFLQGTMYPAKLMLPEAELRYNPKKGVFSFIAGY